MRLKELQLSKDLKDKYATPAEILKKYGWDFINNGVFGAVAKHPNKDYVLKLFRDDSGYLEFVEFALHYQNVHLPRISKEARKIPGTDYYYVRMEELTPVSGSELASTYFPEIIYLTVIAAQQDMEITDLLLDIVIDKLDRMGVDHTIFRKINLNDMFNMLGEKPDAAWMNLVNALIKYGHSINEPYLDLHDENFMKRGNTLIINDPW